MGRQSYKAQWWPHSHNGLFCPGQSVGCDQCLSLVESCLWPSFRLWSKAKAPRTPRRGTSACRAKGYTESTKELNPGGPLPNPCMCSKYLKWVASLWNKLSRELVRRAACPQIAQHNWVSQAEARNSARGIWDICHLAHLGHRQGPCTISTLKFNWTSARFRPSHSKLVSEFPLHLVSSGGEATNNDLSPIIWVTLDGKLSLAQWAKSLSTLMYFLCVGSLLPWPVNVQTGVSWFILEQVDQPSPHFKLPYKWHCTYILQTCVWLLIWTLIAYWRVLICELGTWSLIYEVLW